MPKRKRISPQFFRTAILTIPNLADKSEKGELN